MLESANPYKFEDDATSLRDTGTAVAEQEKLEKRLGLDPTTLPAALKDRLNDFTVNCHLSIIWYQKKLANAIRGRRWYFALSLLMLAFIPLVLLAISYWASKDARGQAVGITTQLGAVVTGLLAFQRGVSAWLDKRQVVAGYSKASSDLKVVLYSFEQTWDGVSNDPNKYGEFLLAIKTATAKCKDIVREETDRYFQTLSYPTIDVGSILKSSASDAQSLVERFAVAKSDPGAGAPSAANQVGAAKVQQLRQRVDELDQQIAAARAAADAKTVASLMPVRDGVLRDLRAAQVSMQATSPQVAA